MELSGNGFVNDRAVQQLSTSEVAAHLSVGRRTVEKHLGNIFGKLGVQSRERLRLRLGVLPPLRVRPEKPRGA